MNLLESEDIIDTLYIYDIYKNRPLLSDYILIVVVFVFFLRWLVEGASGFSCEPF